MDDVGSARFRRHITGISRNTDQFAGFGLRQQSCLKLGDETLGDTGVGVDQDRARSVCGTVASTASRSPSYRSAIAAALA
ncbi:hypothetical protein [Rhodococcus opacus]|uniref:hypothetical protein n=1 Tax=Rhodococcus opacus TaxID=37919 RepID=UPI0006BB46F0|nr:hypothetical protein [Rhodococcus opacus]